MPLSNETKDRIAREAESQYVPCGGCGASKPADRCVGCFHSFAQLAADGYIAGAEKEAERCLPVIDALAQLNKELDYYWNTRRAITSRASMPETIKRAICNAQKELSETLTKYHSPSK